MQFAWQLYTAHCLPSVCQGPCAISSARSLSRFVVVFQPLDSDGVVAASPWGVAEDAEGLRELGGRLGDVLGPRIWLLSGKLCHRGSSVRLGAGIHPWCQTVLYQVSRLFYIQRAYWADHFFIYFYFFITFFCIVLIGMLRPVTRCSFLKGYPNQRLINFSKISSQTFKKVEIRIFFSYLICSQPHGSMEFLTNQM